MGQFDVLVGINLLREGLDLPEVSLVAILDADKEGFLRSDRSLIQTIGRAARNVYGTVILYADSMTDSMKRAIDETERRRRLQGAFNQKNGITPQSITKALCAHLAQLGGSVRTSSPIEDIAALGKFDVALCDVPQAAHTTAELAGTAHTPCASIDPPPSFAP